VVESNTCWVALVPHGCLCGSVLLAHLFCFAFEFFMDFGLHAGV
jgi:hypothetical protein